MEVKKWNRLQRASLIPSSGIIYRSISKKQLLHPPFSAGIAGFVHAVPSHSPYL